MSIIIPTIEGYEVRNKSGDLLLETNNISEARELLEGTTNMIHYIFREIEEDATVHWGVSES